MRLAFRTSIIHSRVRQSAFVRALPKMQQFCSISLEERLKVVADDDDEPGSLMKKYLTVIVKRMKPEDTLEKVLIPKDELKLQTSDKVAALGEEILFISEREWRQVLKVYQITLELPEKEWLLRNGRGLGRFDADDNNMANDEAAVESVAAAGPEVKEKEFFDVKLASVPPENKIKIIKEVRALTGLGLKEAKELVEKAPVVIKSGLKKEEAEALKATIATAGGQVEIL